MHANPIEKIRPLGFQWETKDPFLFCVHHEDHYPPGNQELGPDASLEGRHIGQDFTLKDGWRMYHGDKIPGFPGHPHRGFETITVVRKGLIDHADSTGAAGRYGNGDVQWMTAGKGVQHSEMFPLLNRTERNSLELFQIWLNLPAAKKMVNPHFQMLWSETIPQVALDQARVMIEVISGNYGTHQAPPPPPDSWAADPTNAVGVLIIHVEAGGSFVLPATEKGINRSLFYYLGSGLTIENTEIPSYHAVDVAPEQDLRITAGDGPSKLLLLQGRPILEPVVQYGPFVMNSRDEIQAAFEEYHLTAFGGWPWPSYDMVHDPKLGRFAKHTDGSLENR